MSRKLIIFTVTATLLWTSACTMTPTGKAATIGVGVASMAIGGILIATGPVEVDSDYSGTNDSSLNDDYRRPIFGMLLALTGLVVFTAGLTTRVVPDLPLALPADSNGPPGAQARVRPPSGNRDLLVPRHLGLVPAAPSLVSLLPPRVVLVPSDPGPTSPQRVEISPARSTLSPGEP